MTVGGVWSEALFFFFWGLGKRDTCHEGTHSWSKCTFSHSFPSPYLFMLPSFFSGLLWKVIEEKERQRVRERKRKKESRENVQLASFPLASSAEEQDVEHNVEHDVEQLVGVPAPRGGGVLPRLWLRRWEPSRLGFMRLSSRCCSRGSNQEKWVENEKQSGRKKRIEPFCCFLWVHPVFNLASSVQDQMKNTQVGGGGY